MTKPTRALPRIAGLFVAAVLACTTGKATPASAGGVPELYSAKTVVTGQGEQNRLIGFRECLRRVLVKVSGDPRLGEDARLAALLPQAAALVDGFRYRDLLEGVPIHDEQGTYDRPHELTCLYRPDVLDGALAALGRKPWTAPRPALALFLSVHQAGRSYLLSRDGDENPAMEESLAAAADLLGLAVLVPEKKTLSVAGIDADRLPDDPAKLANAARLAGADRALIGSLAWSDADLGWVAQWHLAAPDGGASSWSRRGVSFDEAFRGAMRGAAQILSGNGAPQGGR